MAAVLAQEEQPISRTYQYRKVMKPMLERKRRARINRCLDELKELLVGALQAEGESVSRLEKADVLELTVRHLHKLRRVQQMNETSAGERFRAGFVHCANEVSQFMSNVTSVSPNPVDLTVTSRLMTHLDNCIQRIDGPTAAGMTPMTFPGQQSPIGLNILTNYTPPSSPVSSPQLGLGIHGYPLMKSEVHGHGHPNPISPSPAHLQSQSPFGGAIHKGQGQQGYPMALTCRKSPGSGSESDVKFQHQTSIPMDEPFDLSNNVWRPW